tara:strand:- start:206 stop:724 length:519 start_codon:yes stop_codon:yes gene_type:complete
MCKIDTKSLFFSKKENSEKMSTYIFTREGRLRASQYSCIPMTVRKTSNDGKIYTIVQQGKKQVWLPLDQVQEIYSFQRINEISTFMHETNELDNSDDSDYEDNDIKKNKTDDYIECFICDESGGMMIICDTCDNYFHYKCAGIMMVPEGEYICEQCEITHCINRNAKKKKLS